MGTPRNRFEILVEFADGRSRTYSDVEEYVIGFKYIYIRLPDRTLSYARDQVATLSRRPTGGTFWSQIRMRGPRGSEVDA